MTSFERTYEIRVSPSPPMAWQEYERLVISEWQALLGSPKCEDETAIHSFLEQHPCLIPGGFGLPLQSGHYSFPAAVISHPPLRGLRTKIPDFMWLASDSMTFYPVLVEIETPTKRWFTEKGYPQSSFTQAHDQLASWKQWFDRGENRAIFLEVYKIPPDLREKAFHPLCILIYGRRAELEGSPELNAKREYMQRADEFLMTFDRLAPEQNLMDAMCTRLVETAGGIKYEALTVPPTFRLGPIHATDRQCVINKDKAIANNPWIDPARKKFLIERTAYWDKWAQSGAGGIINTAHFE